MTTETTAADTATTTETPVPSPDAARIAALEGQLATIETALLAEVPAHLKTLVPAGLSVGDRIGWLQNAKKAGIFSTTVPVPTTDTGKAPTTPRDVDFTKLPPAARMAAGYR